MRRFAYLLVAAPIFGVALTVEDIGAAAQSGPSATCGNRPAMSYIRKYSEHSPNSCSPGPGYNVLADNTHTSCAIQATFSWRNSSGNTGTEIENFAAGEQRRFLGSCADFRLTGARFSN